MEERAESKLLTGVFDPTKDVQAYQLQQQVFQADARVKSAESALTNARNSGASAADIQRFENALINARMQYNNTLDQNKKKYITEALNNGISDGRITALSEDMTNTVRANPGAFDNIDFVPTDFDTIDKVEKEASSRTSELDREIETYNVANANIKNSEEYKRATADRNAVGGHKGGK